MSFGGGGGGQNTNTIQQSEPYAPAQPALNQIISEAGAIYGAGPAAAGYVAPSTQTLQGLATQETMANAANQQIMDTIQGKFSNPFLSPLIAQAGQDVYTNVAAQFSGQGRTPTSMGAQSAVIGQVAEKALQRERNRQLQTARAVPSLVQTGSQLEDIQRDRQLAPQAALAQYYNTIAPIAYGLPTRQTVTTLPPVNPVTQAAGGAMVGGSIGSMFDQTGLGAGLGAAYGLLGGLL